MTNLAGHAGYQVPLWVHGLFTGGVGLTPGAATTRTHFIHHIDARLNRCPGTGCRSFPGPSWQACIGHLACALALSMHLGVPQHLPGTTANLSPGLSCLLPGAKGAVAVGA